MNLGLSFLITTVPLATTVQNRPKRAKAPNRVPKTDKVRNALVLNPRLSSSKFS